MKSVEIYDGATALGARNADQQRLDLHGDQPCGRRAPVYRRGDGQRGQQSSERPRSAPPTQIDHTAPVIGGLSQSVTDAWTKTLSDTITVTASDSGFGREIGRDLRRWVSLGGATLTSGAWTYTASNLAYGANTFTAVATDNAGNTSTSTLTAVDQIDRTAPVIGGISQSGSSTAWTNTTSDTITVSASDSGSGVKSVEIYDGSKDLGAATLSSGAWTYTATNLADGAIPSPPSRPTMQATRQVVRHRQGGSQRANPRQPHPVGFRRMEQCDVGQASRLAPKTWPPE